jgi:large subunit ribosomal protein MRP49
MKNKTASQILAQVISLTKARPVRATAEETRQIRELEEFEERSEEVRQRMAKVNEERRREEAILTQARGEIEAMKET